MSGAGLNSFWLWAAEQPERVALITPDEREVRAGELLAAVHGWSGLRSTRAGRTRRLASRIDERTRRG